MPRRAVAPAPALPVLAAADWPQYLGPTRDGVSTETGLLAGWKAGPRELWRVPVGPGFSSVAVVQGVVYGMDVVDGHERATALDAASGRARWAVPLGPVYAGRGFEGPRATPTVAGDSVVVLTGAGVLAALDRGTGASRWTVDLTSLGGAAPTWGYAGSPLVSDGRIYVSAGGTFGLAALSLADGSVAWSRGEHPSAGYAAPLRTVLGGTDQVVFFTGKAAVGVKPADGALLWSYPWTTDYDVNAAAPVVLGSNRLFLASGYGVGAAALLVEGDAAPTELWRTKRMKNKVATSVLHDGHLYGFNEDRLTCLDVKTGEERWSELGWGRGALVLAEDHLWVLSEDCRLGVVRADPRAYTPIGEPRRVLGETTECWAAPAVSDGVLYLRDNAWLVALELRAFGPANP